MARNYTLEEVETLRNKSGVSYEEAVALLDKYDGDVARALIELEKRGQLGVNDKKGVKISLDGAGAWLGDLWKKTIKTRVIVERKEEQLANLPALFLIFMLILGPYAMIGAIILAILCGCSVSIQTGNEEKQNIFHGDEAADASSGEEEAETSDKQETATNDAVDQEGKDDDFPSITIS